jgi:trk system potassium uptake protein TrkH
VKIKDDSISFETAAMSFIASFPMAAIRKTRLEMGESAMVMGLGILGMIAVKLLRCAGAVPIVAVDPNPVRREMALKCGADYAFDPFDKSFAENVKSVTGGGVKVSRVTILYKGATHEMKKVLRPKQVKRITMDGRVVEDEVVRGVHAYFTAYAIIFVVSLLIIALDCADFTTNFTSVLATLNNIGPGLGSVGPNGGYGGFSALSKIVYIFDMLAGRLEVFPMLLLFSPNTWKK